MMSTLEDSCVYYTNSSSFLKVDIVSHHPVWLQLLSLGFCLDPCTTSVVDGRLKKITRKFLDAEDPSYHNVGKACGHLGTTRFLLPSQRPAFV